jgi:hypothetical protein
MKKRDIKAEQKEIAKNFIKPGQQQAIAKLKIYGIKIQDFNGLSQNEIIECLSPKAILLYKYSSCSLDAFLARKNNILPDGVANEVGKYFKRTDNGINYQHENIVELPNKFTPASEYLIKPKDLKGKNLNNFIELIQGFGKNSKKNLKQLKDAILEQKPCDPNETIIKQILDIKANPPVTLQESDKPILPCPQNNSSNNNPHDWNKCTEAYFKQNPRYKVDALLKIDFLYALNNNGIKLDELEVRSKDLLSSLKKGLIHAAAKAGNLEIVKFLENNTSAKFSNQIDWAHHDLKGYVFHKNFQIKHQGPYPLERQPAFYRDSRYPKDAYEEIYWHLDRDIKNTTGPESPLLKNQLSVLHHFITQHTTLEHFNRVKTFLSNYKKWFHVEYLSTIEPSAKMIFRSLSNEHFAQLIQKTTNKKDCDLIIKEIGPLIKSTKEFSSEIGTIKPLPAMTVTMLADFYSNIMKLISSIETTIGKNTLHKKSDNILKAALDNTKNQQHNTTEPEKSISRIDDQFRKTILDHFDDDKIRSIKEQIEEQIAIEKEKSAKPKLDVIPNFDERDNHANQNDAQANDNQTNEHYQVEKMGDIGNTDTHGN